MGRAFSQTLAGEGATIVILDINKEGMEETIESLPKGNQSSTLFLMWALLFHLLSSDVIFSE